jgi:hypothetical protein
MAKRSNLSIPTGWANQDRRFAESVKENLDVLVGHRGDKLDRAVTFRDLLDAGIVKLARGVTNFDGRASSIATEDDIPNLDIPPAPTNLTASGAFRNIILTWNLKLYGGHSAVQVFRHTSDSIANATMVAQVSGFTGVYADEVGSGQTFYYWVRAVNQNDVLGPFNSSTGVQGVTSPDVTFLLSSLTTAITSSQLATSLSEPIAKIPGIETFTGYTSGYSGDSLITRIGAVETTAGNAATSAQLSAESTARANADSALASDITTLTTTVGNNTTSISTNATSINGVEAQYTVKIDNNGHVSGFGLASTTTTSGPTSAFIVRADRFAIIDPSSSANGLGTTSPSSDTVPFVYQSATTLNGVSVPAGVYMVDAFVKNGSIVNAKIGNAAIDDAKVANLSADKLNAGKVNTSLLNIDGATLTSAVINGVATLQVNELNANVLTSGTLNTSLINLDGNTIHSDGGTIKIKNLGVDTLQIANNAVTIPTHAALASNVVGLGTSYIEILSITWTSTGAPTVLFFNFHQTGTGNAGNYGGTAECRIGSTVLRTISLNNSNFQGKNFAFFLNVTPSAGSQTVSIFAKETASNDTITWYANKTQIFAIETKK